MKTHRSRSSQSPTPTTPLFISTTASLALFLGATSPLQAASYFWDSNGASSGGSDTDVADGTWGSDLFWSLDATGDTDTTPFLASVTIDDSVYFSAGTNVTGASSITVDGTQSVDRIYFEEGSVDLSGGTILMKDLGRLTTSGNPVTISSILDGQEIRKFGASSVTLTAANIATGRIQSNAGTLVLARPGGGTFPNTIGLRHIDGDIELATDQTVGLLRLNGNGSILGAGTLTVTDAIESNFPSAKTATLSATLAGTFTSFKKDGGTQIITGDNTFSAPIEILAGSISVPSIGNVADLSGPLGLGSNAIQFGSATEDAGGKITYTGAGETSNRIFNFLGAAGMAGIEQAGTGPLVLSANLAQTGTGDTSFNLSGSSDADATFSGSITDGLGKTSLVRSGSGTGSWFVTGANTFTGTTTVAEGRLVVETINSVSGGSASSHLGAPTTIADGTITIGTGGILVYEGTGETTDRVLSLDGNLDRTIVQNGTGLLKFTSGVVSSSGNNRNLILDGSTAGTGEIDGEITDADATRQVGIIKNGTGTWTLSGINTYTRNTTVNDGSLILADGAQLVFTTGDASESGHNVINGTGAAMIDGDFLIDTTVTDASALAAGSWTIVNNENVAFSDTFSVVGWNDDGGGMWSNTVGPNSYTFDEGTGMVLLNGGDPYLLWIDSFFLGESDLAIVGPDADPDKDGVSNRVEYALNGNPDDGSDLGLLAIISETNLSLVVAVLDGTTFTDGAGGTQTATVGNITYNIQGALDLATFDSAVSQVGGASDTAADLPDLTGTDWEYKTFKLDDSEGLSSKGFLRVEVSAVP
ncbi:beta strand repeat-containing protein [Haloferula chungangensis]|uniref:Beta strand repeat-containing protein n=1 Tax=Haloferula chungangensis TaxID=1048331 RepID=A0ABW2L137_9BACT